VSVDEYSDLNTPNLIIQTQGVLKMSDTLLGSKMSFYINDPQDGRKKYDKVKLFLKLSFQEWVLSKRSELLICRVNYLIR
jgi:hypothetical protein